jgi:hypothetical protein
MVKHKLYHHLELEPFSDGKPHLMIRKFRTNQNLILSIKETRHSEVLLLPQYGHFTPEEGKRITPSLVVNDLPHALQ